MYLTFLSQIIWSTVIFILNVCLLSTCDYKICFKQLIVWIIHPSTVSTLSNHVLKTLLLNISAELHKHVVSWISTSCIFKILRLFISVTIVSLFKSDCKQDFNLKLDFLWQRSVLKLKHLQFEQKLFSGIIHSSTTYIFMNDLGMISI